MAQTMVHRPLRAALYGRISTTNHGQDVGLQTRELRQFAEARGWHIYGEYLDEGISGATDSRPELNRLMINERSSSATAPRTVKTILPAGVEVSICSEKETKSIPRARNVSKPLSKCDTDLANLSKRQTHTTSNRLLCASFILKRSRRQKTLSSDILATGFPAELRFES